MTSSHDSTWKRACSSTKLRLVRVFPSTAAATRDTKQRGDLVAGASAENVAPLGAFLTEPVLFQWLETLTQSAATIYDRALDAEYLRTHVGGGYHRLFDGGHDLWSAWTRVRGASAYDGFVQEVAGYSDALWKDLTTPNGLPFATWNQSDYQTFAERLGSLPGVSRAWIYDAVTYDAFEVLAAGLGAVGLIFALQRDDLTRLSEMLGSLGVTAAISANPLLGLALVATVGHAYWRAKNREHATTSLDGKALFRGVALAGTSAAVFATLAGPIVVKLVVAVAVTGFLRTLTGQVATPNAGSRPDLSPATLAYLLTYDRDLVDSMRV